MKAFQSDREPKNLYFTNYDRVDEEVHFQQIFTKLKADPSISIGKKQIGPSEDYYDCKISNSPFTLCYDIDYGTSVYAEDTEAIKKLLNFFNHEADR